MAQSRRLLGNVRGPQGEAGPGGSVSVGTTTTGAPGSNASVTQEGTPQDRILNFTIPRGAQGLTGTAATVTVGPTTTGAPGTAASVTPSGTPQNLNLNFTIPRGRDAQLGLTITAHDLSAGAFSKGQTFLPVNIVRSNNISQIDVVDTTGTYWQRATTPGQFVNMAFNQNTRSVGLLAHPNGLWANKSTGGSATGQFAAVGAARLGYKGTRTAVTQLTSLAWTRADHSTTQVETSLNRRQAATSIAAGAYTQDQTANTSTMQAFWNSSLNTRSNWTYQSSNVARYVVNPWDAPTGFAAAFTIVAIANVSAIMYVLAHGRDTTTANMRVAIVRVDCSSSGSAYNINGVPPPVTVLQSIDTGTTSAPTNFVFRMFGARGIMGFMTPETPGIHNGFTRLYTTTNTWSSFVGSNMTLPELQAGQALTVSVNAGVFVASYPSNPGNLCISGNGVNWTRTTAPQIVPGATENITLFHDSTDVPPIVICYSGAQYIFFRWAASAAQYVWGRWRHLHRGRRSNIASINACAVNSVGAMLAATAQNRINDGVGPADHFENWYLPWSGADAGGPSPPVDLEFERTINTQGGPTVVGFIRTSTHSLLAGSGTTISGLVSTSATSFATMHPLGQLHDFNRTPSASQPWATVRAYPRGLEGPTYTNAGLIISSTAAALQGYLRSNAVAARNGRPAWAISALMSWEFVPDNLSATFVWAANQSLTYVWDGTNEYVFIGGTFHQPSIATTNRAGLKRIVNWGNAQMCWPYVSTSADTATNGVATDGNVVITAHNGGLIRRSTNRGETFTAPALAFAGVTGAFSNILYDRAGDRFILYGTAGDLLVSHDKGVSWTRHKMGNFTIHQAAVLADQDTGKVYVGTTTSSVLELDNL